MKRRPALPASPPVPPDHLDQAARAKWAELLPILLERGDLDQAALDGLEVYAVAYSQWRAATAKVDELGTVIKSAAGFAIVSPYVTVAAQAERRVRLWAAELKITPKARGKARSAEGESAVSLILRQMDGDTKPRGRKATA